MQRGDAGLPTVGQWPGAHQRSGPIAGSPRQASEPPTLSRANLDTTAPTRAPTASPGTRVFRWCRSPLTCLRAAADRGLAAPPRRGKAELTAGLLDPDGSLSGASSGVEAGLQPRATDAPKIGDPVGAATGRRIRPATARIRIPANRPAQSSRPPPQPSAMDVGESGLPTSSDYLSHYYPPQALHPPGRCPSPRPQ